MFIFKCTFPDGGIDEVGDNEYEATKPKPACEWWSLWVGIGFQLIMMIHIKEWFLYYKREIWICIQIFTLTYIC